VYWFSLNWAQAQVG